MCVCVCVTLKRKEINIEFILKYLKERETLEELVVNGRNVKMDLKCTGREGMVVICLTQDKDAVNEVMNLRVP